MDQKKLVAELKTEWKKLWNDRFDDKIRAEGVAIHDYSTIYVDIGTVIHATRDYKALDFKDVLQQYKIENPEKYSYPRPAVGGWNKFIKTKITKQQPYKNKCSDFFLAEKATKRQQPKKGGRGWLHK
jgi:hypothetical protein